MCESNRKKAKKEKKIEIRVFTESSKVIYDTHTKRKHFNVPNCYCDKIKILHLEVEMYRSHDGSCMGHGVSLPGL